MADIKRLTNMKTKKDLHKKQFSLHDVALVMSSVATFMEEEEGVDRDTTKSVMSYGAYCMVHMDDLRKKGEKFLAKDLTAN